MSLRYNIGMGFELTPDQQKQLDMAGDTPVNVRDPRGQAEYILVPVDQYEQMLEVIEDDTEQRALQRAGARGLSARLSSDQS